MQKGSVLAPEILIVNYWKGWTACHLELLYSIKYMVTCFPCSYEYTQVKQINHLFANMYTCKLKHQGIFLYTEIRLFLTLGL